MDSSDASRPPTPPLHAPLETNHFLPLSPYTPPSHSQPQPTPFALPSPLLTDDSPPLYHGFPYYRLQLTLSTLDRTLTTPFNSVLLPHRYYTPYHANAAAMDLAQACRSNGEIIMLMKERELGDRCVLKEEIVVGSWKRERGGRGVISLDSVYLLSELQGYMARRAKGDVTGGVQIFEFHENRDGIEMSARF
ncbi:hypothetical protein K458DRAFT_404211 [Lentithecium fluviatile CBS 122367]|uniref:Uncharacterized protein n=1 Tax=Lentithecium fluviatile CBS 122367 TaxID=1168545 RepID=A0A6G1J268_9PLEO|nr:hypothetical protein K458DRAFT_404211 [Lentithecium fluviatile CBS 122367]